MKQLAACMITAVLCALPLLAGATEGQPAPVTPAVVAASAATELQILQKWSGDFPLAELMRLPAEQRTARVGYFSDPAAFAAVWEVFRPGETPPAIDFDRQLVIFCRNISFYNRLSIGRITLDKGVAELLAMETMSARPLEDKAAMALAVVPRSGVTFIKGNGSLLPVPPAEGKNPPGGKERFIGEFRLNGDMVAVVAEGDREPRSIGSYTVRIYADLYNGSYVTGIIRPRNGFIRAVRVADSATPGQDEITVVMETAGSGRYATTDVFCFNGRELIVQKNED